MNVESIISDDEKGLVKALKFIFPNVLHINCFFHYKKDIIDYFKSLGFTKQKSPDLYLKSKNIINLLGKLPLEYNGKIEYIDNILNKIKSKYPKFINIIDNYFIKYKYKYFISGEYNYNKIQKDCSANSYLENYNLYIKKILGKKYNLKWNKFINFLKDESERIRKKLTTNRDINLEYYSKYSTFGKDKYNNKSNNINSKFITEINLYKSKKKIINLKI